MTLNEGEASSGSRSEYTFIFLITTLGFKGNKPALAQADTIVFSVKLRF